LSPISFFNASRVAGPFVPPFFARFFVVGVPFLECVPLFFFRASIFLFFSHPFAMTRYPPPPFAQPCFEPFFPPTPLFFCPPYAPPFFSCFAQRTNVKVVCYNALSTSFPLSSHLIFPARFSQLKNWHDICFFPPVYLFPGFFLP